MRVRVSWLGIYRDGDGVRSLLYPFCACLGEEFEKRMLFTKMLRLIKATLSDSDFCIPH